MNQQKFKHGDLVQVDDDLGPHMRHFTAGCRAIVIGSYRDEYGGGDTKSYTLHLEGHGETSWYDEHQLTLIESGCAGLLAEWIAAEEEDDAQKSDLDWVFANGEAVLNSPSGATIEALALCLGIDNMWGSQGEGVVYFSNSMAVLRAAAPFLESGDKPGWLEFCAKAMKNQERKDS